MIVACVQLFKVLLGNKFKSNLRHPYMMMMNCRLILRQYCTTQDTIAASCYLTFCCFSRIMMLLLLLFWCPKTLFMQVMESDKWALGRSESSSGPAWAQGGTEWRNDARFVLRPRHTQISLFNPLQTNNWSAASASSSPTHTCLFWCCLLAAIMRKVSLYGQGQRIRPLASGPFDIPTQVPVSSE